MPVSSLLRSWLAVLLLALPPVSAGANALEARVIAASARYLGTPYALDPLGEGAGPDPDPRIDRRRVDCVTFVEQVLAEALAPTPEAILPTLLRIRYRDGVVGFARRNHYFVADWLPNNAWLVTDLTDAVGGRRVRRMTKWIDRAPLFRARGVVPTRDPHAARGVTLAPALQTTTYLPRSEALTLLDRRNRRLPSVTIAVFVQDRPGIFAAHTGFLLAGESGSVLRHASRRAGRVLDEPLARYLKTAPARVVGLKVVGLRPAAAVPPRR